VAACCCGDIFPVKLDEAIGRPKVFACCPVEVDLELVHLECVIEKVIPCFQLNTQSDEKQWI
jgi:hypothetical protein